MIFITALFEVVKIEEYKCLSIENRLKNTKKNIFILCKR